MRRFQSIRIPEVSSNSGIARDSRVTRVITLRRFDDSRPLIGRHGVSDRRHSECTG